MGVFVGVTGMGVVGSEEAVAGEDGCMNVGENGCLGEGIVDVMEYV